MKKKKVNTQPVKADVVDYVVDTFTDFAGVEHKFVVAAIIKKNYNRCSLESDVKNKDEKDITTETYNLEVAKVLSIGISVCCPADEFDEEIGLKQATGRAIKNNERTITVSKSGLMSSDVISFFLNRTVKSLKECPGLFLPWYNPALKKYLEENK